jgi:hypothetical protein
MSDELHQLTEKRFTLRKRITLLGWIWLTITSAAYVLVVYYRPFANLLGIEAFEVHHGVWPEVAILCGTLIVLKAVYLRIFRRSEQRAEFASLKEALLQGRVQRMSLATRCIFLLGALALVSVGWFAREPIGTRILALAVPLFLIFAAVELNFSIQPGETLLPDPHDELLLFFRARMLKVGYVTAILALTALYVASLFASPYMGLLVPIALTISLLVPAFVYRRLDRQADE